MTTNTTAGLLSNAENAIYKQIEKEIITNRDLVSLGDFVTLPVGIQNAFCRKNAKVFNNIQLVNEKKELSILKGQITRLKKLGNTESITILEDRVELLTESFKSIINNYENAVKIITLIITDIAWLHTTYTTAKITANEKVKAEKLLKTPIA